MIGRSSGRGTSRNQEEPGKPGRKPGRRAPRGYKTHEKSRFQFLQAESYIARDTWTCQHSHNLNSDFASHLQISCQSRNSFLFFLALEVLCCFAICCMLSGIPSIYCSAPPQALHFLINCA